jgi:hypothetical protein
MDIFNIPDNSILNQVFFCTSSGSTSTNDWQIWEKPKNCKFVNILAIGGGGGGGAGFGTLSNGARGGGGGGSAANTRGSFLACLLPDRLYIKVANGGAGGTNSVVVAAGAGGISYVSIQPNTTSGNILLASGSGVAGAGAAGAAGGGGGGGTAGAVFSQTNFYLSTLGIIQPIVGVAGTAAGVGGTTMASYTIDRLCTPGLGGAGFTLGGSSDRTGNITGAGFIPTISGGTNSTAAIGGEGSSGFQPIRPGGSVNNRYPFFSTGGAGGGSSQSAKGGSGGHGSFGSGGGGGGANNSGTNLGGDGGDGGDGIVIITAW